MRLFASPANVAALILLGCSSGSSSDIVPVDAVGLWRGEWRDNGDPIGSHPMYLDIEQLETGQLVGTSSMQEMACMPVLVGIDNGHVNDSARLISGRFLDLGALVWQCGTFIGTVSGDGQRMTGTISIGNTVPGNVCCCFDVPFTATKQPPALQPRQSRRVLVFDGAQLVGELRPR